MHGQQTVKISRMLIAFKQQPSPYRNKTPGKVNFSDPSPSIYCKSHDFSDIIEKWR